MLMASGVFIFLGAVSLVLAKLWSIHIYQEEKYKGKAYGTVAQIVAGEPDRAGLSAGIHDYYYPVVAFYANGLLYKLRYHKGSNPSRYSVNEKLDIRYDEKDPTQFEIKDDQRQVILSSALYYAGLLMCCIGGIFFLLFATRG